MWRRPPNAHELFRLRVRQRAEEKRVEHTEHRGVDTDAEGERQRGDDGKTLVFEQHAKAITQILRYRGHTRSPVSIGVGGNRLECFVQIFKRVAQFQNTLAALVVTVKSV